MVYLSRPSPSKSFKGYLPQILLGPFLNTLSHMLLVPEVVVQSCSLKKMFIEISQNSRETPVQEPLFCKISKNTFFHRTPLVAASVIIF